MKILICSYYFAPNKTIGAVRPTMLAKYLARLDHEVTIISVSDGLVNNDACNNYNIHRIPDKESFFRLASPLNTIRRKISNKRNRGDKSSSSGQHKTLNTNTFRRNISLMCQLVDGWIWAKSANNYVKSIYSLYYFDIVISSFGPINSLFLGYLVKRKRLAKYWINDLRDMLCSCTMSSTINGIYHILEHKMFPYSDVFTVTSKGLKKILLNRNSYLLNNNVYVVYNGYDDEINDTVLKFPSKQKLILSYTGDLYEGVRDLSLLFNVITELAQEKKISIDNILFIYAGGSSAFLEKQITNNKVFEIIEDRGKVSRMEAYNIQAASDILVLATWNTEEEQGILTGKFFEYLQKGKNIVAIVNGDKPDSEITEMVIDLNVGLSCENARYKDDYIKLKQYIHQLYIEKMKRGSLSYYGNSEMISKFKYVNIVKRFEQICQEITSSTLPH